MTNTPTPAPRWIWIELARRLDAGESLAKVRREGRR